MLFGCVVAYQFDMLKFLLVVQAEENQPQQSDALRVALRVNGGIQVEPPSKRLPMSTAQSWSSQSTHHCAILLEVIEAIYHELLQFLLLVVFGH